jgi:hypothetical protein
MPWEAASRCSSAMEAVYKKSFELWSRDEQLMQTDAAFVSRLTTGIAPSTTCKDKIGMVGNIELANASSP